MASQKRRPNKGAQLGDADEGVEQRRISLIFVPRPSAESAALKKQMKRRGRKIERFSFPETKKDGTEHDLYFIMREEVD